MKMDLSINNMSLIQLLNANLLKVYIFSKTL